MGLTLPQLNLTCLKLLPKWFPIKCFFQGLTKLRYVLSCYFVSNNKEKFILLNCVEKRIKVYCVFTYGNCPFRLESSSSIIFICAPSHP